MKLDRALQLKILEDLAEHFPKRGDVQQWTREEPALTANLHYLRQHGLVDGTISQEMSGNKHFITAEITAAGLDFLADDGGLTAILGVVTVKLHDDTIRQMLLAKIDASDLPPEEKQGWRDKLRELRGESIKHLTMKLLDKGAESLPAILDAIQTSL